MSKKLLLADDSVTIQRVIELTFAGEDVQVLTAGDGEEAIARIPKDKPDIILADIGMPKRSGYEVSAFVKNNPETENIPVLLLAGAFEPVDDAKAKEAKCDGVLVKPFEPQHVIARVRELIGGAKGNPGAQAVRDIPRPAAVLAPPRPVELPKREDRPAIPDDLMDIGEDDLLPREDALPAVDLEPPSPAVVIDDSLDDYFDKLDEAFATINTPAHPSAAPVARPDRPALEQDFESFDSVPLIEPPPLALGAADPFAGIDAIETDEAVRVPTLDDLLADMPAPEPAHVIDFPSPPTPAPVPPALNVAAPAIEPPETSATLAPAPSAVEGPAPRKFEEAAPRVFEEAAPRAVDRPAPSAAERPHDAGSTRSIIADAFSALLAAEQGEPGAAPLRLTGNSTASAAVTDSTIDEVARRVIERLALGSSDQLTAMVRDIVSGIAERLIREEIDRIRQGAAGSGQ